MKYHVWFDSPKETVKISVEASSINEANQKAFLKLADKRTNQQHKSVDKVKGG